MRSGPFLAWRREIIPCRIMYLTKNTPDSGRGRAMRHRLHKLDVQRLMRLAVLPA